MRTLAAAIGLALAMMSGVASPQINVPTPPELSDRADRPSPGQLPDTGVTTIYSAYWVGAWRAGATTTARPNLRFVEVQSADIRLAPPRSATDTEAAYYVSLRFRIVEPAPASAGPWQTISGVGSTDSGVFSVLIYGEPYVARGVPRCGFYLRITPTPPATAEQRAVTAAFPRAAAGSHAPWRCGSWESLSGSSVVLRRTR